MLRCAAATVQPGPTHRHQDRTGRQGAGWAEAARRTQRLEEASVTRKLETSEAKQLRNDNRRFSLDVELFSQRWNEQVEEHEAKGAELAWQLKETQAQLKEELAEQRHLHQGVFQQAAQQHHEELAESEHRLQS